MAYGVLYEFTFESTNGADCLIQIQKKDYTGEVKKRKLGRSPVLKRENNDRIYGTSCEIYAECVEDGEFSQLYTSSPYEFRVEVYRNNQLLWVGFVSPELYSEPDIAPPYDVQIIATDGLGELKDYSWSRLGLTTIHNILIELLGKSGLDRSFYMVSDLTYKKESGAMSSPDDLLSIRLNLDHEEDESYYDVLQNLLASFNLNISTYKNKWILFRETDFLSKSQEIESEEFGSMLTCEYWPVGQLSVAIEPAKKSVELESPNHYRDNILDFNSWSLSNNARYSEDENAYILPPSDNSDIQSEISQTVQFEKGVAFSLALKVKAGELGYIASVPDLGFKIEIVGAIDGAASHFYLRRSDISSGNPSTDYVLDPYEVGSLESYNTAFYETVKMPQGRYATAADAKDIDIVIPLYYNSDNVFARADQLKISIFSRNQYKDIRIYEARLIKYEQTKGYKANVEINNNAREEGSDVEIPLTPGDQVPKNGELFMTGIPIQPSSNEVITLWQTQNAQEEKYLSFMAQDIARSIAQPKMKYTGTLNVPGNRYDLPLLFSRDNTYYFPKTYTLDLYNDELNVELISVSAADVSLESVVISQIAQAAGQTGGMTSGGGSTGGGYVPIPLDKEMSDISDNAVANRVIKSYVDAIGVRLSTIETYFSTTEDVDTQINKWNEIVTFLNATEETTLAGILATYAKKDDVSDLVAWYNSVGVHFKKRSDGVYYVEGDLYTEGQFAATVVGTESGGSAGATYLSDLFDVSLGSLASGDLLSWNGSSWVNIKQSSLVPDLSAYATKSFVTSQGYITSEALAPYATTASLAPYAKTADVNNTLKSYATTASLNTLAGRVTTLENKATAVSFSPSLTSGKQIGVLTIDGVAKSLYAPSMYDWSEINAKPTKLSDFTDDVVAGKYQPLATAINTSNIGEQMVGYAQRANSAVDSETLGGLAPEMYAKNLNNATGINIDDTTFIGLRGGKTFAATGTFGYDGYSPFLEFGADGYTVQMQGRDGAFYARTCENKIWGDWKTLIHSDNIASHALPLTGGTISNGLVIASGYDNKLTLNNTDSESKYQLISFQQNGVEYGSLGTAGNDALMWNFNTIIHSGNIEHQTVGAVKEYEVLDFVNQETATIRGWHNWGNPTETSFAKYTHGIVATSLDGNVYHYLGFAYEEANPRVRSFSYGADSGWKTIALLDDNVASATKLQTARSLWGNSFDGTSDIGSHFYYEGTTFIYLSTGYTTFGNTARTTYIDGNGISFNASGAENMTITTSGNVIARNGITTNEITIGGVKIDVANGALRVNGDIFSTGQFAAGEAGTATGGGILDYNSIVDALGYTPANQANTYTKQEVNNLLSQSGGSVGNNYMLYEINNGSHTIPNGVNSVIVNEDNVLYFGWVTPEDTRKPCIVYLVKSDSYNLDIVSDSFIYTVELDGSLNNEFSVSGYMGMMLVWDTKNYRWMAYLQN